MSTCSPFRFYDRQTSFLKPNSAPPTSANLTFYNHDIKVPAFYNKKMGFINIFMRIKPAGLVSCGDAVYAVLHDALSLSGAGEW